MSGSFEFSGPLWLYDGESPWVFVTLPPSVSDEIEEQVIERRGFGSLKVSVRTGETAWTTSIFPDKTSESFILPVKRSVREREQIAVGDVTVFTLTLLADH